MKRKSLFSVWAFPCLVISALVILSAPYQTDAYVLEGPHILELTATALGKIASLQVKQNLLIYPLTPETPPIVFDETAIYVMPERFRSDIISEQIQRTHLVFADSALTVIDGRLTMGKDRFDIYQQLLRSRSRRRLIRSLNILGVETSVSSFGRLDETVVFVVGARYPDESASQICIDKETFLPLRLLLVDEDIEQPKRVSSPQSTVQLWGASENISNPDGIAKHDRQEKHSLQQATVNFQSPGERLEIFYRDWQKVQSGWFPFQVVFYVNGRLAREIRVEDIRLNPSIPSEYMDLEALKTSVTINDANTSEGQKQEAVEEVQKVVEDFQKKFD